MTEKHVGVADVSVVAAVAKLVVVADVKSRIGMDDAVEDEEVFVAKPVTSFAA